MGGLTADAVGRVVRCRGIELGRVADVLLVPGSPRVLGFAVDCRDGRRRFLPEAAADVEADGIETLTPLILLDWAALDYYLDRGAVLGSPDGARVAVPAAADA